MQNICRALLAGAGRPPLVAGSLESASALETAASRRRAHSALGLGSPVLMASIL